MKDSLTIKLMTDDAIQIMKDQEFHSFLNRFTKTHANKVVKQFEKNNQRFEL